MPFEYKRVSDTTSNASDQATRSDSAAEKRRRRLDPHNNEGYASPTYDQIKRITERHDHDSLRRDHSKTAEGYEGQLQERTRSGRNSLNYENWAYDADDSVYRAATDAGPSQQGDSTRRYDKNYAGMTQEELGVELAEKLIERLGYHDNNISEETDIRAYLLNVRKLDKGGFEAAKSKLQNIATDTNVKNNLLYRIKKNYVDLNQ